MTSRSLDLTFFIIFFQNYSYHQLKILYILCWRLHYFTRLYLKTNAVLVIDLTLRTCVLSRFSCVWLIANLWTIAHQAPLTMRFSRQEYCSGLPYLLQGVFLTQGPNLCLLCLALAGVFFTTSSTWEAQTSLNIDCIQLLEQKVCILVRWEQYPHDKVKQFNQWKKYSVT